MPAPKAKLVFLSGSKAGTTIDLGDSPVTIGRKADRTVNFSPEDVLVSTEHCSVSYRDGRYVVRDDGSRNGTFVNSTMTKEHVLEHGDLIQLGPGGPSIRFVLETKPGALATVDVASVAERQAAELAASGRVGELRTRDLVAVMYYRVQKGIRRTVWTLLALGAAAVLFLIWLQQRNRSKTDQALARIAVAITASSSMEAQDVAALSERYAVLRDAMAAEGKTMGHLSRVSLDAIGEDSRGVALIVYRYGYTRPNDTLQLRYVLDAQGQMAKMSGPGGTSMPKVAFDGSGPPVERYGTATGFLVDSEGYMVTNRSVVEPWATAPELAALRASGLALEGHMIEMRAFLPPGDQSFAVFVHKKSDSADVAILRLVGKPTGTPVLRLAPDSVLVRPGDQVLSIGYPSSAADLLFRVDSTAGNDVLRQAGGDTWKLVEELARRKLIQPVVADGSVKTTTATEVTDTARAVVAGNGGPLIDARQRVVAVQSGRSTGAAAGTPGSIQGVRIAFTWDILPAHIQHALGNPQ